jgi:hypothetical protein
MTAYLDVLNRLDDLGSNDSKTWQWSVSDGLQDGNACIVWHPSGHLSE